MSDMECSYISDTAVCDMACSDSSCSEDWADFALVVEKLVHDSDESEADLVVENFVPDSDESEAALEVEKLVPDSDESEASSDFFTPSQLAKIKAVNYSYMEVSKEEEKHEVEELVPDSDESSDFFTPSQLSRIKAVNEAYSAWNEEKEREDIQAMILDDLSITQYTGYGAFNVSPCIPRVIDGLQPKVHCNQLITNWLLNESNLFDISFY